MKRIAALLMITLALASCGKSDDGITGNTNTTSICFDTVFLNANTPSALTAVFFLDGKNGFAADSYGVIFKTTDSAKIWTALQSPVILPIYGLYFTDALHGIAVGGQDFCGGTGCTPPGGFILRTTDGGQSWAKVYTPSTKIEIVSVYFTGALTGFCVGGNIIMKTVDGGQNWSEYPINNIGGVMMQVMFTDSKKGYVVCVFDEIVQTEDGGISWQLTSPRRNIGYYSVSGTNTATYVSGQGKIIKSVNGGSSWNELPNSPSDIYAIHFTDDRNGFAFGRGNYSGGDFGTSYGSMYCTTNGGETWNGSADIKQSGLIQAASFPAANIGYAISGKKVIRISVK